MQIRCYQCANLMTVPDQAAQLGGLFTCPFCRTVTTLAPPGGATASGRATAPEGRSRIRLMTVLGAVVGSLILIKAKPLAAALLGAGVTVAAVLYLMRSAVRNYVDRLLRVESATSSSATLIAVFAAVWSFFVLFLFGTWNAIGGPERASAARAARAAEVRQIEEKKAQEEVAARRAQAEARLNEAEALLGVGELERARRAVELAKELDPASVRAGQVAQMVEDEGHRQRLATLPARHTAIAQKVQAGAWGEAASLCVEARAIDPKHPQIAATCGEVDAALRKHDIAGWIAEANRAAEEQCDTPAVIGEAWKNLRQIRPEEAGYAEAKKAAARLEKCRKSLEKTLTKGLREIMVKQRVEWAARYEAEKLNSGIDLRLTLSGKYKDLVKIRWVLLSRVMVHQITRDGSFLTNLERMGFKRVTFSDGFYESWYYDLNPQDEDDGGSMVLRGVGLDRPIKM